MPLTNSHVMPSTEQDCHGKEMWTIYMSWLTQGK